VEPAAGAVTIGSAADYTITDKATGAVLFSGSAGSATVTLRSTVYSWYRLQVACGSASAIEARRAAAEAAGIPTFTELAPAGCTRLFLGRFPTSASFSVRNAYRNELIAAGHAAGDSFWAIRADPGVTEYTVSHAGATAVSTGPVVLASSDGLVSIAGARYRGTAEVLANSAGTLAGVNQLLLEEYLYGVLPRELPPTTWPEMEAQKAQAVAARTYAMRGLGKRRGDGYDLLPTTTDQVYGGLAAEHPLSTRAVDETRGVVATYDGALIEALFSSTTG
jgi:hypothetical protein